MFAFYMDAHPLRFSRIFKGSGLSRPFAVSGVLRDGQVARANLPGGSSG